MFWQLWHICIFWTTVQKLSCFTGSFASMPIGRREKYKDLIFTAHIGQQNPGITKIIPSVDKRRVCPCQLRVGKGKQKL